MSENQHYTPEAAAAWLQAEARGAANQLRTQAADEKHDAEDRTWWLEEAPAYERIADTVSEVPADVMKAFAAALSRVATDTRAALLFEGAFMDDPETAHEFCRRFVVHSANERDDGLGDAVFEAAYDAAARGLLAKAAGTGKRPGSRKHK